MSISRKNLPRLSRVTQADVVVRLQALLFRLVQQPTRMVALVDDDPELMALLQLGATGLDNGDMLIILPDPLGTLRVSIGDESV